jgi:hypothetical protein
MVWETSNFSPISAHSTSACYACSFMAWHEAAPPGLSGRDALAHASLPCPSGRAGQGCGAQPRKYQGDPLRGEQHPQAQAQALRAGQRIWSQHQLPLTEKWKNTAIPVINCGSQRILDICRCNSKPNSKQKQHSQCPPFSAIQICHSMNIYTFGHSMNYTSICPLTIYSA